MTAPAIETLNLTKEYPHGFLHLKRKTSLENLTMQVEDGEVFGFLGPNGAGKSTTIKLLMGIIFPTAGSAQILGKPVSDVSMHRDIGYLPEQPYFYDYLTAAEVLDYFARFHGFSAAERKERVQKMLRKVGLETAGKIQLRKFSKGMLQRVGLAQAIVHDPKLLILDEPMSGLDPVGRREVRDIILELKNAGKTILFSTHILSDVVKSLGMEIIFELTGSGAQIEKVRAKATKSGANYRMSVSEAELFAALEELRGAGATIISVTQIKPTLEDFFMELVGKDRAQAAAVEVSGQ
jgi:ABC-2 type transport system ATP-binding protein